MTRSVVDVASGRVSDDLRFTTLGVHSVRDIPSPIELFQLCEPGLRASFPPLRTSGHTTSPIMAVVAVDEVRASRHLERADDQMTAWQRQLIHALRTLSVTHDGRHLKLLGDGCLVAFDDPRSALAFADRVHDRGTFRVGVALGLVEEIEGELTGRTVFDAYSLMKAARPGEVNRCSTMRSLRSCAR